METQEPRKAPQTWEDLPSGRKREWYRMVETQLFLQRLKEQRDSTLASVLGACAPGGASEPRVAFRAGLVTMDEVIGAIEECGEVAS